MKPALPDRVGRYALAIGASVMLASLVAGRLIQSGTSAHGHVVYMQLHGVVGWASFLFFAFGFPAGLGLIAIGLYRCGEEAWKHILVPFVIVLVAILSAAIVPLLFGREPSAVFFGTGGCLIFLMLLVVSWFWGRYRLGLPREKRVGTDLKGAGYFYMAVATWNLCGVGGMPSFALEPDRMIALGTKEFATGQMKTVMVLLLIGWFLTALGYYKSCKDRV